MLKHLTILCLFIALATQSNAQVNLVQNGDFGTYIICPDGGCQLANATGWSCPNFFTAAQDCGTMSEYYNECSTDPVTRIPGNLSGGDYAQSGSAYVGFYGLVPYDTLGNRCKEYIQGMLINPLKTNKFYCCEMYIQRADFGSWAMNDMSVYFSNTIVNDSGSLDLSYFQPQITNISGNYFNNNSSWVKYTGYFKAQGGEKYLIIGSFLPTNQTPTINTSGPTTAAYYFIDNVQLYECGDSLNTSIKTITPTIISINPNPAAENVTITLPPNTNKVELFVYTVQGQLLSQTQLTGTQTINTNNLANGLYLFVIQLNGNIIGREKVVIGQ